MADLGNLKILLDMSTTGTLKDILKKTDDKLDDLRKKAANIKLSFDEDSAVSQIRDLVTSMQEVSKNAGTKLAEGMKQSADATKGTTAEMKQQVTLSSDLEALFKEMAGTVRTIAESHGKVTTAKKASVAASKEEAAEEQKLYDITRLRQMAEQKNGQLEKDEVAVLKQMEAVEKALVDIDQKHSTNLADQLKKWMHYNGITKEQLGVLQSLVTRMQAMSREEQKIARQQEQANRKQKQAAKEREAAAKRQAQLESSIVRIETRLVSIDQTRLSEATKLLVAKMRTGQITQEEVNHLSAVLAKEQAILGAVDRRTAATANSTMQYLKQSRLLQQINSYLATYVSVIGAANLIKNLVRITGEFEAQHVALRAILQDVAGADRIFYQLQELAVKSPFTFRNLTEYAKQLSAFSVPMNEIYDTTKRLADVSAGLGVDMSRIILAYGQIRSASFLRGQEVRQLTEAGIPVLQELSKQFKEIEGEAVSVGKVFDKISARQVPFEMIEKMFKDLTSEGGKFYQMQEVLAETVKGKLSNLQDAWEIMLSKVGESNSGFIKGALDGLTNLIKNYRELAKALELAAVAYGSYRVACIAATQAETMQRLVHIATGQNLMKIPALLSKVTIGLRNIPKSIIGIVSKLNVWALAFAAVSTAAAAVAIHILEMNRHIRETDKITGEAISKAEASKSNIQYYIKQMKEAKEGTEEYNKAREAVIQNSGSYISATDAERLSLQNVDDVWVSICKHIEEATKLQAMQSVTANAEANRNEKQLKIIDEVMAYQKSHKLSAEDYNFVMDYIKGNKTYTELYNNPNMYGKGRRYLFQNAVAWKEDWDAAQRVYEETIEHGKKRLSSHYGTGERKPAGPQEPLTGWRLRAQNYLDTFNGKTRGVKDLRETGLADLAEKGAKELNQLRADLNLIPVSEADRKTVEDDIAFWQGLSEAIYGEGKTEFGNTTKLTKQQIKDADALRKEQIQAIKQSVQDLKEAKRWYDQLTPLLGDKNAKTLLASFNFAVPKEGFSKAFRGYADQLTALGDENGARDVMNWANGREVGDVLDSAKAIEKYTDALRDLDAQTRRLNFSGLAQEIDKIIVDTDSKNRQLETNWEQKAEELAKAKSGWIQRYRIENEKATAEDAEKAWQAFYDAQTAMAKKSIDAQAAYNRKVAQEQINDKASKWLEEMMKENNINLYDMGDKSLEQVNTLIDRLSQLTSDDALSRLIPDELKDDAKLINVEFSKLLSTIKKIANTKLGDLSVEKMKKTLKGVKAVASTLGINTDTSAVESSYSTLAQALTEVANAQEEVNAAEKEFNDNADKYLSDYEEFARLEEKLSNAKEDLAKKTGDADKAQRIYNAAIAVAGVGAFASALGKVASNMKELADAAGDESLSEFSDTVGAVAQNFQAAAAGYAAAASAGAEAYAWIGAIIGGLSDIIIQLTNVQTEINKYNYAMDHASDGWALAVARVRNEYALLQEQLDTMFGSATMSKMRGWADIVREQGAILREFNSGEKTRNFLNGTDPAKFFDKAVNGFTKDALSLAYYNIKTKEYNAFQEMFGYEDQYAFIKDLAPDLFNEDGSINFGNLDEFKNTKWYEQLSDDWKKALDEMEEANKQFESACKEMKDYLTSIFGDMGASISESLISAFESTGEAAMDTSAILTDVAKKFVSDWTQSFLSTKYLQGLDDAITDIWMDSSIGMEEQVAQSLGLVRDSLYAMQDSMPYIQQFYEGLEDQFHWADGAGEDIGDAIKTAMVEQNSSLIAGYINSIRADLTMQRNEIMSKISPAMTGLYTSFGEGTKTHMEYMEAISGNVAYIAGELKLLTQSGSGVKLNARI